MKRRKSKKLNKNGGRVGMKRKGGRERNERK